MMHLKPLIAALCLLATPAWAVAPESTDPVEIMKAVEARAQGDKVKARLSMTITDDAGRQRQRVVQSRMLDFEGGRKQLMVFESPADVKDITLLSIDYDDGAKDDDQWLSMPSLKKNTRISNSGRAGSFMGTDLSYADMTKADPSHYDYVMLDPATKANGEPCWLIEARPKTKKAKEETGYLKTRLFISKAKLLPIRTKAWVLKGKKLKYIEFKDIKQVNGLWIAHTIIAQTKKNNVVESTTVLRFTDMSFDNADVVPADFAQRSLEYGQ